MQLRKYLRAVPYDTVITVFLNHRRLIVKINGSGCTLHTNMIADFASVIPCIRTVFDFHREIRCVDPLINIFVSRNKIFFLPFLFRVAADQGIHFLVFAFFQKISIGKQYGLRL